MVYTYIQNLTRLIQVPFDEYNRSKSTFANAKQGFTVYYCSIRAMNYFVRESIQNVEIFWTKLLVVRPGRRGLIAE